MIFLVISAVLFVLFVFYHWFHRMPLRTTPFDESAVISPADGVVWKILAIDAAEGKLEIEKQFLGKIEALCGGVDKAAVLISIFMSPLDSHLNWSPVDGKVIYARHTPGNFSYAKSWKSFLNEKNEILMDAGNFRLKLIQIAGFLARRIDCWVGQGERLSQGEPFGMIRFGSQVSLILPAGFSVCVKNGEMVRGGETVLARTA